MLFIAKETEVLETIVIYFIYLVNEPKINSIFYDSQFSLYYIEGDQSQNLGVFFLFSPWSEGGNVYTKELCILKCKNGILTVVSKPRSENNG